MNEAARALTTRLVEKVWGCTDLPKPFAAPHGQRIGEIWFEPPPELPQILVKYLFTSEKLSVQVHPSVADARGGEAGKEEAWLVLDADPGAQLAIGFEEPLQSDQIKVAALDGSIERLLTWHDARAGDVFFLPAGTVHAIGPGLTLLEVQQNSATTFRLYDYGRSRELHLERGLKVANGGPYAAEHRSKVEPGGSNLVNSAHFRIDRIEGAPDRTLLEANRQPLLVLPLSGLIRTKGGEEAAAGECLYAENAAVLDFADAGVTILTRPN